MHYLLVMVLLHVSSPLWNSQNKAKFRKIVLLVLLISWTPYIFKFDTQFGYSSQHSSEAQTKKKKKKKKSKKKKRRNITSSSSSSSSSCLSSSSNSSPSPRRKKKHFKTGHQIVSGISAQRLSRLLALLEKEDEESIDHPGENIGRKQVPHSFFNIDNSAFSLLYILICRNFVYAVNKFPSGKNSNVTIITH